MEYGTTNNSEQVVRDIGHWGSSTSTESLTWPLLSPERFARASEYCTARRNETGNDWYAIRAAVTSFIANHYQQVGMALSLGRAKGAAPGLRNGHLAGEVHPKTSVPFDKSGYSDFRALAKIEVTITRTGTRAGDFRAANEAAGLQKTPEGYTWHHHQDGTTMQLVPRDIHAQTGHTGGFTPDP
jgi:hypothetical protein